MKPIKVKSLNTFKAGGMWVELIDEDGNIHPYEFEDIKTTLEDYGYSLKKAEAIEITDNHNETISFDFNSLVTVLKEHDYMVEEIKSGRIL